MKNIYIELNGGKKPTKGSEHAAAYDLYVKEDYELSKSRHIIPTGICMQLPVGWKANVRPRSGFSAKGMEVEVKTTYRRFNGEEYISRETTRIDADVLLGLIDCDYRDEIGVIVRVHSLDAVARQRYEFDTIVENHIIITRGTRIAQLEICGGEHRLVVVDKIDRTIDRGGGYGHTGTGNEQGGTA